MAGRMDLWVGLGDFSIRDWFYDVGGGGGGGWGRLLVLDEEGATDFEGAWHV